MKYIFAIFLFLVMAAPAYAQDPTPAPGGGGITVNPDNLPYTFEPISYTTTGGPMSTQLNMFSDVSFINLFGSTAITLFTLADTQNVLGIFVVLLLAAWLLWKIFKFTTTSTPGGNVDFSVPELPYDPELNRPYVNPTPSNIAYWEGRPRVPYNLIEYYNKNGELRAKYTQYRVHWQD